MPQGRSSGRIGVDVEETNQHKWNYVFNVVQMISENKTLLSVHIFNNTIHILIASTFGNTVHVPENTTVLLFLSCSVMELHVHLYTIMQVFIPAQCVDSNCRIHTNAKGIHCTTQVMAKITLGAYDV